MSKEKRLGRGLENLLSKVASVQPPVTRETETPVPAERQFSVVAEQEEGEVDRRLQEIGDGQPIRMIPVDRIDRNPHQPRLDFDPESLKELAASLQQHGLLQPLVVREKGDRFELIVGERRLRAATLAGWSEVPAILLVVDDRQMAELALTENMQRKDLNPIEKAYAFQHYLDLYGGTKQELANRLELERSTVSNIMRLLELPEALQKAVRNETLPHCHARAILPLEEAEQLECAARIIEEGWSVRQTEDFVKKIISGEAKLGSSPAEKGRLKRSENDPQIRELEQQFRTSLGMKVQLCANAKGRGKLVIQFGSAREFERIYQLICPRKRAD